MEECAEVLSTRCSLLDDIAEALPHAFYTHQRRVYTDAQASGNGERARKACKFWAIFQGRQSWAAISPSIMDRLRGFMGISQRSSWPGNWPARLSMSSGTIWNRWPDSAVWK